jgi:hypothetical protein
MRAAEGSARRVVGLTMDLVLAFLGDVTTEASVGHAENAAAAVAMFPALRLEYETRRG